MKKKIILSVVYSFVVICSIFAQKIESLTYYDVVQDRNITVRVFFAAWEQQYLSISNAGTGSAKLLTYSAAKPSTELAASSGVVSEWSEWELTGTEPLPYADVNTLISRRDLLQKSFISHPVSGMQITIRNGKTVRILAAPSGRGNPVWFDENNNLNVYYNVYIVVP
jgi:hypothetical protein